ncbi:hypothetical protein [Methylobacterium ajmalii]|jgi:hypothetical protein|uniref:hypothetical protein n=1 Tax=Methylobacterium ajmalii TaxID=2738439 RepID=UPI00190A9598|nr:hypothetical protein [Methylobacterium ajmalii]MBK3400405.1 hypothetical protein [Methylobacterium ajmalii]MBK3407553.1 hypothetical protein [Methylobacterium ajmalii]MBK3422099.1 hypothetical protein [Methylobacterium ajmalii]MBZ6415631.1 hypothetical protein [Methylobacterium sp.]
MAVTDQTFTEAELAEFDNASRQSASRDQVVRISGRQALRALVERHGKPKCDAMWEAIQAREKAARLGRRKKEKGE